MNTHLPSTPLVQDLHHTLRRRRGRLLASQRTRHGGVLLTSASLMAEMAPAVFALGDELLASGADVEHVEQPLRRFDAAVYRGLHRSGTDDRAAAVDAGIDAIADLLALTA